MFRDAVFHHHSAKIAIFHMSHSCVTCHRNGTHETSRVSMHQRSCVRRLAKAIKHLFAAERWRPDVHSICATGGSCLEYRLFTFTCFITTSQRRTNQYYFLVPKVGFEPTYSPSEGDVLPLDDFGMVPRVGIEPTLRASKARVLPLDDLGMEPSAALHVYATVGMV